MAKATGQPGSHKLLVWMQVIKQVGYWVTFVRVKLVGWGGGLYMAFFPECKDFFSFTHSKSKSSPSSTF